jgi:hypothetical protein
MLRGNLGWLSWVIAAVATVQAAIGVGIAIWAEPGTSVWAPVGWVLQWVAFAGGIALATSLPVLVAHGLTRRGVSVAGIRVVLVLAVGMALVVQVGLVVEWLLHRAAGLSSTVDGRHLFDGIGQVHLVVLEYGLTFAAFMASGWLVGLAYYRYGALRGTLLLPLAGLPVAGALAALSAGSGDGFARGLTVSVPLAVTLALLVVTAALLAVRGSARTVPIATT